MTDLRAALDSPTAALRGIALMVFGSMLLTLNDAILKWLVADYPVGQLIFLRAWFVSIPIAVIAWRSGGWSSLRVVDPRGHLIRALFVICSSYCFMSALRFMPFPEATAILFASPLFVTALSVPVLGERVGWRRWTAVCVGFAGVVIIIRPTGDAFQLAALLVLAAALFGALRDLTTRRITAKESSTAILVTTTTVVGLSGLLSLPVTEWRMPQPADLALLAITGTLMGSAHFCLIECFRQAEAALVAPFKYSALLWAGVLGWLMWRHVPDAWAILGAGIVVASGLYILHRELHRRRSL
ncbi:MAG: DMT family transporter [Alphaproteobacteria bacterium]